MKIKLVRVDIVIVNTIGVSNEAKHCGSLMIRTFRRDLVTSGLILVC